MAGDGQAAPVGDVDAILAAAEMLIAQIDGRPVLRDLAPDAVVDAVAGLGGLVYALAAQIQGDQSPAAVRALLVDLQVRTRLADLFGGLGRGES